VISLPEALTPDINLVCVYLSALEKYGLFYDACSPAKSGRKPAVLLQHGLIDSSATWVMNMPDQSLGFVLADLGYDVWLGENKTYIMVPCATLCMLTLPAFVRFSL